MKTCYSETCMRLDCRTCEYKSNLEIELHNTEQAENNIKYFLVILIILSVLGV
jgi:hypothetical protein